MTTREQYNQMIAALEAAREGKIIEFRFADRGQHSDGWLVLKAAGWNFNKYEYRPAPEPKPPRWVAWTFETCPLGIHLKRKPSNHKDPWEIILISKGITGASGQDYETLFDYFEQLDGSPCGTLVKEEGE